MTKHSCVSVHRVLFYNNRGHYVEPRILHYSSLLVCHRQQYFIAVLPNKPPICHYKNLYQL